MYTHRIALGALYFMLTVNTTGVVHANDEQSDIEAGRTVVRTMRQVAGVGSIVGGWSFALAIAQRYSHLSYRAKRLPLMVFLASGTLAQLPAVTNVENNTQLLAALGRWFNNPKGRDTKE